MEQTLVQTIRQWGIENLPEKIYNIMPKLIVFVAIIIIGFWASNKIGKLLVKILDMKNVDKSVHRFVQKSLTIFLKIIFVVIALEQLGININSFITALGAAGITAGLGLQNSISQFASGIQILFNKPFKSGDYIEIGEIEGKVKEIRFMYTVLVTRDNKEVVIPNQQITTNPLINYTKLEKIRIEFIFSISYKEDIDKAREVLMNVSTSHSLLLKNPKPEVGVFNHGDSSVELVLHVWCKSDDYWDCYYSVQEDAKKAFDKNGINIPYNQLDVHVIK